MQSKSTDAVTEKLKKNNALKNPLITGFLNNDSNYQAFREAIVFPCKENDEKVEQLFLNHYETVRKKAYFNNLIKYFAIDFDKRIRKLSNRFVLTLDKPMESDSSEGMTPKDLISEEYDFKSKEGTLKAEIGNKVLYQTLDILSELQYKILELIYVKNLTNIEIASLMNSSPQNISNIHRKAIKKLKKNLEGGFKC
ncbi:sigma-70 family RNA polymerase sigma factor [Priestia megaterium]|uniref:sigma-70 family RNA polymerase sigma factor n=1 Tax=Priestia megaterium TaxID=1404 RepID=UPI003CE872B2